MLAARPYIATYKIEINFHFLFFKNRNKYDRCDFTLNSQDIHNNALNISQSVEKPTKKVAFKDSRKYSKETHPYFYSVLS